MKRSPAAAQATLFCHCEARSAEAISSPALDCSRRSQWQVECLPPRPFGARDDRCVKRALRLINIRFGNRHQIAGVHERREVAVPGAQEGIQLLGAQHHGLARVHVADHERFF